MIKMDNFQYFSIKSYVVDVYSNRLTEADFPHFYYMLGGNLGSLLYGDVPVMVRQFSRGDERIREDIPVPDSLGKETFLVGIFTSSGNLKDQ